MKYKYDINLLIERKRTWEEDIVYFILHYFKHILVITQIIIIFSFFYRLSIDQEIVDFKDTAGQQKEIISVVRSIFDEAKSKYERMVEIEKILDSQDELDDKLNYLLSIFPQDFYLESLKIDETGIILDGKSLNYLTILKFMNRLKSDNRFSQVELKLIEKEGDLFSFVIELKNFRKD